VCAARGNAKRILIRKSSTIGAVQPIMRVTPGVPSEWSRLLARLPNQMPFSQTAEAADKTRFGFGSRQGGKRMFSGAKSSKLTPPFRRPACRNGWGWRAGGAVVALGLWVSGGVAAPLLKPLSDVPMQSGEATPQSPADLGPNPIVPPEPSLPTIPAT